ncbi:mobility-associated LCxxNW protein [Blautia sp.]|uniref:mobility-associated LCxxNW protein n=1 Tax=Blautia sp. TaxID=1955243 RepID=UPI002A831F43|nr:mobility-associated LCxxNW protein [Blautia sp.]MDD7024917.1 mobility-associated LCxxNW protein [Oscillospiraceae bacterium]MDY4404419.1 mobility-associated LCxxNW protein [Blautia sp.]
MKDNCPFSESGKCEIWIDHQILQYALEEAEELADANWTEIKRLYARIDQLTAVLVDAGIDIPEEL